MRTWFVLGGSILLLGIIWWIRTDTEVSDTASERELAPSFALAAMDGSTFRLEESRGKVVILNFWATWCAPCLKEIPDFVDVQSQFGDRVQFVGISVDTGGMETVIPFFQDWGLPVNYPQVIATPALLSGFGNPEIFPTTFILDQEGRIVDKVIGAIKKERLVPYLNSLLENETGSDRL